MTTVKTNMPAQHRARADEARRKADAEASEVAQKALLNEAGLWERWPITRKSSRSRNDRC
jgi:hypothetical protein